MKVQNYLILLLTSCVVSALNAQTAQDSVALHRAEWWVMESGKSYTLKTLSIALFDSPQQISVLEYTPKNYNTRILQPDDMTATSVQAMQVEAVAAVNGSFYNMRNGWPTTFIRSAGVGYGPVSIDNPMLNGALAIGRNSMQIMAWDSANLLPLLTVYPDVMQAGPLLLKANRPMEVRAGSDMSVRHPRTAVGLTRNGRVVCLVVDGRHKGKAAGMNFTELAWIMRQLGCCDALNLDGGGSSTLWTRSQGVVNHPSDNRLFDHAGERKVANVLAILPLKN